MRARGGGAGNAATALDSRSACQPDDPTARTPSTPTNAAEVRRSRRESRPRAATASPISRPSPAASSRLHAPYIGILSRAPQIASVARSHDTARRGTSLGRSQHDAPTSNPGISMKAAWASGTLQGKSRAVR